MVECTGRFFSEDADFKQTSLFNTEMLSAGVTLYEVLRVCRGNCLFLEDHLRRLQESVTLSGYPYRVLLPQLHRTINELMLKNGFSDGNVKILLRFVKGAPPILYTYFIPHAYPNPDMYREGVAVDLYTSMRPHPNVKRLFSAVRQRVSDFIRDQNIYEALLVSPDQTITEGSKTNIFFVRGETIITPPGDKVLKGITRGKIIQLCSQLNIRLIEESVYTEDLSKFDAVFLTGTSPKVLPVRRIGNISFKVPYPVMSTLMEAYDALIE